MRSLRGKLNAAPPVEYPDVGVYHPRMIGRARRIRRSVCRARQAARAATVGLLLMRSYVLANNTAHYDAVIAALEARGLRVDPGVRQRPRRAAGRRSAISRPRRATIDALVSLTGFSLVGGPAYNDCRQRREDARRARRALSRRARARIPDARGMGGFRPRPSAGRERP